jgi:hypothetical protein
MLVKMEYIAFFRVTNTPAINYVLYKTNVLRYGCIKNVGALLDSKRHFNQHAVHLFSRAVKLVRPNTEYKFYLFFVRRSIAASHHSTQDETIIGFYRLELS